MKNTRLLTFLLLPFFLFSQGENQFNIIDFTSSNYPVGEKVKILYNKDWKPVTEIDSADYYRIVKFKEKNIPLGKVVDYIITSEKQNSFYASYIGLNKTGLDSIVKNGTNTRYFKNGNKSVLNTLFENVKFGIETSYYKNGNIRSNTLYENDLKQGEQIGYYESGAVEYKLSKWVDGLEQGDYIAYYESGTVKFKENYLKGIKQGEQVGYYESGAEEYKLNYVDDLKQGELIGYYESGAVEYKTNYIDDLAQGEQVGYYESGAVEFKRNYIDDLAQGEQVGYYESGAVEYKLNYVDDLKQGKEFFYYESGEIDYTKLWNKGDLKERKIALVIGNALYEKGPLKNPVNDANLIAESLEKLDFEVELYNNLASRDEMLVAIKDFGRKRNNYEVAFIYYAGHGIQLNNENYLLPVNEEFEVEVDVEDNGVSMQRVLRCLESTRENQLNIIVLDACRDNPFESNWNKTRSIKGGGLAKIPPPTGSLIAFSTDHGQTAADGDGGNSLYSLALAEKLLEENVSIEQVFKNVRTEVLKLSMNTQSPVEESKLTGDVFYLNKTEN